MEVCTVLRLVRGIWQWEVTWARQAAKKVQYFCGEGNEGVRFQGCRSFLSVSLEPGAIGSLTLLCCHQGRQHYTSPGRLGPTGRPVGMPKACGCLFGLHPPFKPAGDLGGLSKQPQRVLLMLYWILLLLSPVNCIQPLVPVPALLPSYSSTLRKLYIYLQI